MQVDGLGEITWWILSYGDHVRVLAPNDLCQRIRRIAARVAGQYDGGPAEMRAVVQRVSEAGLEANGEFVGRIGRGLLVYVGIGTGDTPADAAKLAEKVAGLRIFDDNAGKLNWTVQDVGGAVLAVPNFTLMADTRKGRRPSFAPAANGQPARDLFEHFVASLRQAGPPAVTSGVFGAHMEIHSCADGPVNVLVDVPADGAPGRPPP